MQKGFTLTCWLTTTGWDRDIHVQSLTKVHFRLIRPVANSSDRLTVHMRLKLSQVIGVVSDSDL